MFLHEKLLATAAVITIALGQPVRADGQESPAGPIAPRVSIQRVRGATQTLNADIGHLVEDLEIDLRRGLNGQHLLDDAREAAESAEHLAASLDQGVDLNHAIRDFQEFDKSWHHVAIQLRTAGASRSLQRGVMQVAQTDATLHRMLSVPAPVDVQEVRRLAESLAQCAQQLLEDAQETLGLSARYGQLLQIADDFAEAAEHFRRSIAQGVNVEHARKDFGAVDEAWQVLSDRVYTLSPYRLEHLQEAASQVESLVGQLAGMMGVAPEPRSSLQAAFRFDSVQGRRTFAPDSDDAAILPPSYDLTTGCRCVSRRLNTPNDDESFDGPFAEDLVLPPSSRSSQAEIRSLERPARSGFGRRFDTLPAQRLIRPLQPEGAPQPRRGTSEQETHEHSDGHNQSHGLAPAATPAKPTAPGTTAAKRPAPRPAEPALNDEARANLAKLSSIDRDAAIAQGTCPVTGDLLGEMGVPIKVRVQDRDVFVCCKGCVAKLQRQPEKYLPRIQQ